MVQSKLQFDYFISAFQKRESLVCGSYLRWFSKAATVALGVEKKVESIVVLKLL